MHQLNNLPDSLKKPFTWLKDAIPVLNIPSIDAATLSLSDLKRAAGQEQWKRNFVRRIEDALQSRKNNLTRDPKAPAFDLDVIPYVEGLLQAIEALSSGDIAIAMRACTEAAESMVSSAVENDDAPDMFVCLAFIEAIRDKGILAGGGKVTALSASPGKLSIMTAADRDVCGRLGISEETWKAHN